MYFDLQKLLSKLWYMCTIRVGRDLSANLGWHVVLGRHSVNFWGLSRKKCFIMIIILHIILIVKVGICNQTKCKQTR